MKDAYYFPHYTNARRDNKIRRIIKHLGVEGYGIFFMLLEVLREQSDLRYPMQDVDLLADEFGTSEEKVKVVITGYDLFNIDQDGKFFSPKLVLYLQPYFEKSDRARSAALKRWDNANAYANALPGHSASNASKVDEVKESKVNEVKKSRVKRFHPPAMDDVILYFSEKNAEGEAEKFYDYYESVGWKVGRNAMKDWKAAVRNWISRQKQFTGGDRSELPF